MKIIPAQSSRSLLFRHIALYERDQISRFIVNSHGGKNFPLLSLPSKLPPNFMACEVYNRLRASRFWLR